MQNQLPSPPPLTAEPVFVLGLWRSGTTYLHDLLSACPDMLYPATWQCMNPASYRLQSPPARGVAVRRPMDGMTIDNFSPQEDEFALLALGVPSVYRGFLDPRRLPELTRWLEPDSWVSDRPDGWLDEWRQFLTGVADGRPGRLVLKSPNHSFRINALAEAFPAASYVWLARDPIATFLSNRKMWKAMFNRYALWAWDDRVLDEFLCHAFRSTATCLRQAAKLLPRERLAVVPFASLTGAPLETMQCLNSRLNLGTWVNMSENVTRVVAAGAGYRPDTYEDIRLPGAAGEAVESLRSAQTEACLSHGL
jgi:hypothetical protein